MKILSPVKSLPLTLWRYIYFPLFEKVFSLGFTFWLYKSKIVLLFSARLLICLGTLKHPHKSQDFMNKTMSTTTFTESLWKVNFILYINHVWQLYHYRKWKGKHVAIVNIQCLLQYIFRFKTKWWLFQEKYNASNWIWNFKMCTIFQCIVRDLVS